MNELLGEFVIIENNEGGTEQFYAEPVPSSSCSSNNFKWNSNSTKLLIDLYKQYKGKVGTLKIRSIKQMWQIIANELSEMLKHTIHPNNCENKWRVLDRNYKKYIDNANATGRGRKYFEFADEMDSIFAKKNNVVPEVLLSSETIAEVNVEDKLDETAFENDENKSSESNVHVVKHIKKRKTTALDRIRHDRLAYQQKRLQIEEEKLTELRKRNQLIQERNDMLKDMKCCCSHTV